MTDKEIINYIPVQIFGLEFNPDLGFQTGRIIFCNQSTIEYTRLTEPEMMKMGFDFFRHFIHPDDLQNITQTAIILINSDLQEITEFYRVRIPNKFTYDLMKVFCKIIRPKGENKAVQFIVTSYKASKDEILQQYEAKNLSFQLFVNHDNTHYESQFN